MKKIGLLTTLLVGGLLLTGCNKLNSEIDEIRALELAKTKEGRIELCNNKILAEVDSGATNFVGEEVIYSEGDEDSRHSDNFIYFIGSNGEDKVYGCGLEQHGKFIKLFPIDQEFLNSEEYQQLEELREMLTEKDIDEPVIEEPTYEILEWTGYMGCIGGCEDGSDEEYVEGYYYKYTNPELGLRITTPSGDGGNYNEGFRIKRETPIFKLVDNTIYSLEYDYASNWSISDAEFIKVYDKDPSISLENLLKEQYQNCIINKVESKNLRNFHGFGAYFYDIKSDRGLRENNCNAREEGEGGSLVFYIESKVDNKYYKIGINDGCAPGPCSIFGKVEAL